MPPPPETVEAVDHAQRDQATGIAREGAELARSLGLNASPRAIPDEVDVADTLLQVADVPWWWDEKRITTDRRELKKQIQEVFDSQDFKDETIRVSVVAPLPKFEEAIRRKLPEGPRKKLEAVLGPDHRLVLLEVEKGDRKGKGILAVRVKDQKARVVGIVKF